MVSSLIFPFHHYIQPTHFAYLSIWVAVRYVHLLRIWLSHWACYHAYFYIHISNSSLLIPKSFLPIYDLTRKSLRSVWVAFECHNTDICVSHRFGLSSIKWNKFLSWEQIIFSSPPSSPPTSQLDVTYYLCCLELTDPTK